MPKEDIDDISGKLNKIADKIGIEFPSEPFLDRFFRWMDYDVDVCMKEKAYIGAITLMMTNISALASFYVGRITDRPKSPENDETEFITFLDAYFPGLKSLGIQDIKIPRANENGQIEQKSMFYFYFRCGLVHEYLMKRETAIDKGLDKSYLFFNEITKTWTLNVENLYYDYKLSIRAYYQDIKYKNNELKSKFIKRAQFLGAENPIL